jgi:hypothetical protein
MLRMRDLEGEVAVVGQEDQPFGVKIETAHGIDPLADAFDQIDHGPAALRVFDRGHHFLRLVEKDVAMGLGAGDELPVDFDVIARSVGFRSELGDDAAVHRDPSLPNHRLRFAS